MISPIRESLIFTKLRIYEVSRKLNSRENFRIYSNQLTVLLAGAITSLSFVGALNAQQAQEITAAVKSLVQGYLCQSKQVNIESVNYNRNNGYDNT